MDINIIWNIAAIVISVLAIIVTITLFVLSKKKKRLSYEIISNNPVLLEKEDVKGELEILYNGKPVKDVFLSVIRLINNGNLEILEKDFLDGVFIDFGEGSKVLSSELCD